MSDYNTMNAQQCADWLAEREHGRHGEGDWYRLDDYQGVAMPHPFPLTLDGAAAALREPWRLVSIRFNTVGWAFIRSHNNKACMWMETEGPDELTARYRAAVAARMEDDK